MLLKNKSSSTDNRTNTQQSRCLSESISFSSKPEGALITSASTETTITYSLTLQQLRLRFLHQWTRTCSSSTNLTRKRRRRILVSREKKYASNFLTHTTKYDERFPTLTTLSARMDHEDNNNTKALFRIDEKGCYDSRNWSFQQFHILQRQRRHRFTTARRQCSLNRDLLVKCFLLASIICIFSTISSSFSIQSLSSTTTTTDHDNKLQTLNSAFSTFSTSTNDPTPLTAHSRKLQDDGEPYEHGLVHVMDLGIDTPDGTSEGTKANGVTFTLKNDKLDQSSLMFLGLEVYMSTNNVDDQLLLSSPPVDNGEGNSTSNNLKLQLFARVGEDHVNPLEDSSDNWTLLEEFIFKHDELNNNSNGNDIDAVNAFDDGSTSRNGDTTKNTSGQYVSLPFQNSYEIPPNGAVTLFLFVEKASSIVVLKQPSQVSNTDNSFGGEISIQSGSAILREEIEKQQPNEKQTDQSLEGSDTNVNDEEIEVQWVPVAAHAAFIGHIFYEFRDTSNVSRPRRQFRLDTSSLVQQPQPTEEDGSTVPDPYLYSQGIVFNVRSETGCNITYIEISTPLTSFMLIEIYTKRGSYLTEDKETGNNNNGKDSSWTLTSRAGIKGNGPDELTIIPIEQFKSVTLEAEETVAFYITSSQSELISIPVSSTEDADVLEIGKAVYGVNLKTPPSASEFVTLDVQVGQPVIGYPGLTEDSNNNPSQLLPSMLGTTPSIFRGQIHFAPIDTSTVAPSTTSTIAPTSSPTVAPSPGTSETVVTTTTPPSAMNLDPELISQVKLTIQGVSRRTLRKLQQGGGGTMNNDGIRTYFEDVGKNFVNGFVNSGGQDSPPIDVKNFVVSPDIDEGDLEGGRVRNMLRGRYLQEEVSLDVYATVLGEYSPPPVVDFSSLTEDSFNDAGDDFINELKTEPPEEVGDTFREAKGIRAERAVFPKPSNLYAFRDAPPGVETDGDTTSPDDTTKDFLTYIYIVCACAAGLVIIIVTAAIMYKRGVKVQKKKNEQQDEERASILARLANEVREGRSVVGSDHKSYYSNNSNNVRKPYSSHSHAAALATLPNSYYNNNNNKADVLGRSGGLESQVTSASTYCASSQSNNYGNSANFDSRLVPQNPTIDEGITTEDSLLAQQRQNYAHYLRGHRGGTGSSGGGSRSPSRLGAGGMTVASGGRSRTPTTSSSGARSTNTPPFGGSRIDRDYDELQQRREPYGGSRKNRRSLVRSTTPRQHDDDPELVVPLHEQEQPLPSWRLSSPHGSKKSRRSNHDRQSPHRHQQTNDETETLDSELPSRRSLNSSVSEKYWSVSGRHIVSRSGRRVWDAATGEPKDVHRPPHDDDVQDHNEDGPITQMEEPEDDQLNDNNTSRGSKYGMIVGEDDDNDCSTLGTSGLGFDNTSLSEHAYDIDDEDENEAENGIEDQEATESVVNDDTNKEKGSSHDIENTEATNRSKKSRRQDIHGDVDKTNEDANESLHSKKMGTSKTDKDAEKRRNQQEYRLERQRRRVRKQRRELEEELQRD